MVRSTAGLGRELGLNSQEMNILLRDEGYLEGEPGDWMLTEKGHAHASQQHWDVSNPMHAGYVTTRWDDKILEEIGPVSSERRQGIRDEIAARRSEQRRQRKESQVEFNNEGDPGNSDYIATHDEDIDIDSKAVGIAIAAIAGGILLAKGYQWGKPQVEKWWGKTARPRLISAKEQVVSKIKKTSGKRLETNSHESGEMEAPESMHIEGREID